jgi:hypothetical protein
LQIAIQMRGHVEGRGAPLNEYMFEVKSVHTWGLKQRQAFRIAVILWEKGGPEAPLEQRPAIRYVDSFEPAPERLRLTPALDNAPNTAPAAAGSGTDPGRFQPPAPNPTAPKAPR